MIEHPKNLVQTPKIILIAAMTRSGVIGYQNKMPWYYPEDLKYFKRTTLGSPIVMGRKTFESLNGKPLPGRLNLIVTRTLDDQPTEHSNCRICRTPEQVFKIVRDLKPESKQIFIIGGAQIYELFLPWATECLITEIQTEYPGDCYFPIRDWSDWTREQLADYPDFKRCRFSKKL